MRLSLTHTRSAGRIFQTPGHSLQKHTRRELLVSVAGEIFLPFFSSYFMVHFLVGQPSVQEKLQRGILEDILENDERDFFP